VTDLSHTENIKVATKAGWFSMVSNILLAIIKWAAGIVGNSQALIADAIESTADIFGSVMVLLGLKYTSRPADENHPYGHGRLEPLVTFLVVAFLVVSAVIIAYHSIQNIIQPHEVPSPYTLLILAPIILWKEISYRIVMRKARKINSSSLKADAWHHRSDAITSVTAFIGISIAVLCGKGFESADAWAALVASGFILYNAYKIFRPALGEVMDENSHEELIRKVREEALKTEGVLDTEKCFVRKSGIVYHLDLHAIVDGSISVTEGHTISHILKDRLRATIPHLGHVMIHIEPGEV